MASNGDRSRDEIRDTLRELEGSELRELAKRFDVNAVAVSNDDLRERLANDPSVRSYVWINARDWTTKAKPIEVVGTAAAAAILRVERPRIGRWVSKGSMPQPLAWVESGPIWRRSDIEAMREAVDARRR